MNADYSADVDADFRARWRLSRCLPSHHPTRTRTKHQSQYLINKRLPMMPERRANMSKIETRAFAGCFRFCSWTWRAFSHFVSWGLPGSLMGSSHVSARHQHERKSQTSSKKKSQVSEWSENLCSEVLAAHISLEDSYCSVWVCFPSAFFLLSFFCATDLVTSGG